MGTCPLPRLLDAAEEVFGRKGFHEATLKEVAELAELSVGSECSFFDSKEELFRQVFVRLAAELMPSIRAILDDEGAGPVEQLHALIDCEMGLLRRHPRIGRLFLRCTSAGLQATDRDIDLVVHGRREEAVRLRASLFERGQAAGVFRRGDPEVLAHLFSGMMSAYQAMDPAVVSDDPDAGARSSQAELHEIVASAFVVG
ncbi:MAG TPA: TetR/AcrR family transcriptional regulator [Acidimicrobiales bacterium]|nr:TetR/AcrR family transcriptional regulator [Acidimicrobiales bacterium]